jgi:hypothetical protein
MAFSTSGAHAAGGGEFTWQLVSHPPGSPAVDARPRLFAYAQLPTAGVEAGTPILAAIMAYFETKWLHSFNAAKKKTKDDIESVLGRVRPTNLDELTDLAEELVKFGMGADAVHQEHAVGVWQLLTFMYRSRLPGDQLVEHLRLQLKARLAAQRVHNYELVLQQFSVTSIVTQLALEARPAAGVGWQAPAPRQQAASIRGDQQGQMVPVPRVLAVM